MSMDATRSPCTYDFVREMSIVACNVCVVTVSVYFVVFALRVGHRASMQLDVRTGVYKGSESMLHRRKNLTKTPSVIELLNSNLPIEPDSEIVLRRDTCLGRKGNTKNEMKEKPAKTSQCQINCFICRYIRFSRGYMVTIRSINDSISQ